MIRATRLGRDRHDRIGDITPEQLHRFEQGLRDALGVHVTDTGVVLQLTVRSFTKPVRETLFASIDRIVKAEAMAAGATKTPTIERLNTADALVNDSALTKRVGAALIRQMGPTHAMEGNAEMVSEDFSAFALAGIPSLQMRVGAIEQGRFDAAMKSGETLPSLHSSTFLPDLEPTMKATIQAEVISLRELMAPSQRRS